MCVEGGPASAWSSRRHAAECLAAWLVDECERNEVVAWMGTTVPRLFHARTRQSFSLAWYLRRVVNSIDCSTSVYSLAFAYLHQVGRLGARRLITFDNVHRLLAAAFVCALKMLEDELNAQSHYVQVFGISSAAELRQLELHFLTMLRFRMHVSVSDYRSYEQLLLRSAPQRTKPLRWETKPIPAGQSSSIDEKRRLNQTATWSRPQANLGLTTWSRPLTSTFYAPTSKLPTDQLNPFKRLASASAA